MNKYQSDVHDFHVACGHPVGNYCDPRISRKALRQSLIREEASELLEAIRTEDLPEVVDACIDLSYVVYGAAVEYGVDLGDVDLGDIDPIMGGPELRIRPLTCKQISHCTDTMCAALELDPSTDNLFFVHWNLLEICHNLLADCGVDFDPFWNEVHQSNMRKGAGKRADGKALKPEGWQPPRIKEMLAALGRWAGEAA